MERLGSFSLKSTRFLLFYLIVFSSLLFLTFFSVWLVKSTLPPPQQPPLLHLNTSHLKPTAQPSPAHSSFPNLNLNLNRTTKPKNASGFSILAVKAKLENGEKAEVDGNFTAISSESRASPTLRPTSLQVSRNVEKKCDVTQGRWVYDKTYPLYTNNSCPFIDQGFNCLSNGRVDKGYIKWRWQPHHCLIPRFNATKMLELIRGKRLVFVGDSINRNQWESMLCLLMRAVKDPKKVYETHGRRITKDKGNYSFKFVDYRCTVEYYVSHFLVHESKARVGQKRVPTLRIDAIDRGSSRWRGADILVFNTAHWWSHYKTKSGINYYQERDQVHPHLDVSAAFRRALTTWASWVDKHINSGKTKVFFRSSSPSHFRGGQWNSGGHCGEASSLLNETSSIEWEKNVIVEDVTKQMRSAVTILNITGLSGYRIDGHPSIYGRSTTQDCSHWCLPGVPDTWNQLLYFHLHSI